MGYWTWKTFKVTSLTTLLKLVWVTPVPAAVSALGRLCWSLPPVGTSSPGNGKDGSSLCLQALLGGPFTLLPGPRGEHTAVSQLKRKSTGHVENPTNTEPSTMRG